MIRPFSTLPSSSFFATIGQVFTELSVQQSETSSICKSYVGNKYGIFGRDGDRTH